MFQTWVRHEWKMLGSERSIVKLGGAPAETWSRNQLSQFAD